MIGCQFIDFVQHPDRPGVDEALNATAKERIQHDHHFRMVLKQGGLIEVSMNIAITGDVKGGYTRTICMISAISQRVYK